MIVFSIGKTINEKNDPNERPRIGANPIKTKQNGRCLESNHIITNRIIEHSDKAIPIPNKQNPKITAPKLIGINIKSHAPKVIKKDEVRKIVRSEK